MENSSSSSPDPSAVPPTSGAPAPQVSTRPVEYVGFWKRFVAFVIDIFILTVVIVPALLAIYGREVVAASMGGFWSIVIQYVIPAVATLLFWRYRGATPGKMAISARIVDARTHAAPSTGRLVTRYFAYIVSSLPVFIGFFWIGIDRRKQGFHDKIAGTVVVYDDD